MLRHGLISGDAFLMTKFTNDEILIAVKRYLEGNQKY